MKTNHKLAREAAEKLSEHLDRSGFQLFPFMQIIADTQAEAMAPKRIACSERMPDIGEHVLFWDGVCRVHYGWRSELTSHWHSQTTACSYPIGSIEYWQPIPQPPEVTT